MSSSSPTIFSLGEQTLSAHAGFVRIIEWKPGNLCRKAFLMAVKPANLHSGFQGRGVNI